MSLLPSKVAPPLCTQRISLGLRRLRRLADTWCKDTKKLWNIVSLSEKFAKKSRIIWTIGEICLSLQRQKGNSQKG